MAEHYFTKNPTSKPVYFKIRAKLRNTYLEFHSAQGVFSKNRIDLGTQLLINKCIIKPNSDVLDLGCGYGAVGVSLAYFHPSINVLMTDINQRAVILAKKNIKLHKLQNAKAKQSDSFKKIKTSFNHILLNPPQTAGKKLCFSMIEESKDHLNKGGDLQLVARHQKGGKTLSEKMKEVFDNVDTISKKSGYRIYISKKN